MLKSARLRSHLALVMLAVSPAAALAQSPGMVAAQTRYSMPEGRPTVSPYLNMVGNTNLASYQTLVRPIIDEREELNRQWARLDQINQQLGGAPGQVGPKEPGGGATRGRGTSAVRFMHYSHYFGTR